MPTPTATIFVPYSALAAVPPAAHHATHETGGSDPLAALDASVLTSGALPYARFSTEGSWTPVDVSGAGLVLSNVVGRYVKMGKMVFAALQVTFPATANGATVTLGGLPFTVEAGNNIWAGTFGFTSVGAFHTILVLNNSTTVAVLTNTGAFATNATYSGVTFTATIAYKAST